jgi:hypothetical protein
MPSYLHEFLLLLFRNHSASAADLLHKLDVQIPDYDEARTESSDLNDLKPAEYRADLVLFLMRESQKVLGVIVEVQLGRDEGKRFAWPAYVANLRARHRCPVCLLVITTKEVVARWAEKPIELGPGTQCIPWVISPSNIPAVTELEDAKKNVELAILSAIMYALNAETLLAARMVSTAFVASTGIDAERRAMYRDLIYVCLSTLAPKTLEATMNSLGYEYKSDFARDYFARGEAKGRTEGRTEGRVEIIIKLLSARFGPLSEESQTCVRGAQEAQLDILAERMLTAQTLEEALGSLR